MGGGYAGNVTGISEGSKAKQSKQASDRSKAGRHLFGDVLHVYLWVPRARPDIPIVLLPPPPNHVLLFLCLLGLTRTDGRRSNWLMVADRRCRLGRDGREVGRYYSESKGKEKGGKLADYSAPNETCMSPVFADNRQIRQADIYNINFKCYRPDH